MMEVTIKEDSKKIWCMVKVDSSTMMVTIIKEHFRMTKQMDRVNLLEREEFIMETFRMEYLMEKVQKLG